MREKIKRISVDETAGSYSVETISGKVYKGKDSFNDLDVTWKQGYNSYGWPCAVEDKIFIEAGATEKRRKNWKKKNGFL